MFSLLWRAGGGEGGFLSMPGRENKNLFFLMVEVEVFYF